MHPLLNIFIFFFSIYYYYYSFIHSKLIIMSLSSFFIYWNEEPFVCMLQLHHRLNVCLFLLSVSVCFFYFLLIIIKKFYFFLSSWFLDLFFFLLIFQYHVIDFLLTIDDYWLTTWGRLFVLVFFSTWTQPNKHGLFIIASKKIFLI